jgi:amidophosphoribosyltransferase
MWYCPYYDSKNHFQFYKEKYGTAFYGVQKMYLLMEKQHNRGQDGAGLACIKFDMKPGQRYISSVAFKSTAQPIQDVFNQINRTHKRNITQIFRNKPTMLQWQKENITLYCLSYF